MSELTHLIQAKIISNPLLEIEYMHHEKKQKYSFQNYTLSILLEWCLQNKMQGEYKISLCVKPCNRPRHILDTYYNKDRESITAKIEFLAAQYESPYSWNLEHIAWLNRIWEQEREDLNKKGIVKYSGTKYPGPPPSYFPLRIPTGWKVIINSLMVEDNCDNFNLLNKQRDVLSDLHWERDISIFSLELKDYCINVDLQDYSDTCFVNRAFRIHIYSENKLYTGFLCELYEFYSHSIFEVVQKIEDYLLLYKDGIKEL